MLTIAKDEHGISLDQIDRHALYIIEKLRHGGHTAYLVGGCIRDLLLGHVPKDYDISTSAEPEEIKSLFGRQCILIGRRFRLAHIRFGRKVIEVATFRAGDPESPDLITRDNIWGTHEEDVLRRDFTINGLFYDSFEQTLIDYVDGYADIKARRLKMIGEPYVRYKQDPVRMIRLIKFVARFGLSIEHDTEIALVECKGDIIKSSEARVLEELMRMLESGAAKRFFQLMTDYGVLQFLLPDIAAFLEHPDGNVTYAYLDEIDKIQSEEQKSMERAVPLSAIVYPLIERHFQSHFIACNRIPHLGEVQTLCTRLIHQTFQPFFKLPRRISGQMSTILTNQYRMTPFIPTTRKPRIPNVAEFHLALQFLHLRSQIDPELKTPMETWETVYAASPKKRTVATPAKRRRRRRQ